METVKIWQLDVKTLAPLHSAQNMSSHGQGSSDVEGKGKARSVLDRVTSTQVSGKQAQQCEAPAMRPVSSGLGCITCSVEQLRNVEEQRSHFKSDWHRANVRRVARHKPALSEIQFDAWVQAHNKVRPVSDYAPEHRDSEEQAELSANFSSDSMSSLSGSEVESSSDDDDDQASRKAVAEKSHASEFRAAGKEPKVHFQLCREAQDNGRLAETLKEMRVVEVWRVMLPEAKTQDDSWTSWKPTGAAIVLLLGGGHFAGGVYSACGSLLAHKSVHRYTTRKKQGGSQTSSEKARNASSAGASLRRYGAAMLRSDVLTILAQWEAYFSAEKSEAAADARDTTSVDDGPAVFVAAAGSESRAILAAAPQFAAAKRKGRVRVIPMTTRRPTLSEVKRVYAELTTVRVFNFCEPQDAAATREHSDSVSGPASEVKTSVPTPAIKVPSEARTLDEAASKNYDVEKEHRANEFRHRQLNLLLCIAHAECAERISLDEFDDVLLNASFPLEPDFVWQASSEDSSGSRDRVNARGRVPLVAASILGRHGAVWSLMERGADPVASKAYGFAKDKETRDAFRLFWAANPGRYDYERGGIPSMLTSEIQSEQAAKEEERKLRQRARERERKKAAKARKKERDEHLVQQSQTQQARNNAQEPNSTSSSTILADAQSNPREAMAVAAEVRMGIRCAQCKRGLTGITPFERLSFKYCSIQCVQQHR